MVSNVTSAEPGEIEIVWRRVERRAEDEEEGDDGIAGGPGVVEEEAGEDGLSDAEEAPPDDQDRRI